MTRPNLRDYLKTQFSESGGQMPFRQFMELALYDPQFGYYTTQISDVGSRGDFSTWATLGKELAGGIAQWLEAEIAFHNWEKEPLIHLVEVGGGDGSLAFQILKQLNRKLKKRIQYHIVDISENLQQVQKKTLHKYRNTISWHKQLPDALCLANGQAIIYSNELVDAFPINWLRWNGNSWQEIEVAFDPDKGIAESFSPTNLEPKWKGEIPIGQRIELHSSYRDWLKNWVENHWNTGSLLTIDYGAETLEKIYAQKIDGTMRAYFKQNRLERGAIYQRFGKQDLTCDVNFSDLVEWGNALGLETVSLASQLEFLKPTSPKIDSDYNRKTAAEAFLVLHQRKFV